MKFYTGNHKFYCGIDLHARKIYVCIFKNLGKIVLHKNFKTDPQIFFELMFPYFEDVIVGVEYMFSPENSSGSSIANRLRICVMSTAFHLYWDKRFK